MALDYVAFQLLAERLINENGRTLTVVRHDQGNPTDPSKPWRASDETDEISFEVVGVFIDFEKEDMDGTIVRRGDKRVLLAAKDITDEDPTPSNIKIEDYDQVIDGSVAWRIMNSDVIEPGSLRIMYDLHVRQ